MKDKSDMCSQDRKYFRFRFRVIIVAFLLISPSTSSAPKQDKPSLLRELERCREAASALIADTKGFLKYPQNVTSLLGCIKSIPNFLVMIENEPGASLGAQLLLLCVRLLHESYQVHELAKDLAENLEQYKNDFKLFEDEYSKINDYIKNYIEPHWKNGNTAKMVRNLEKVMENLTNFSNRVDEFADHADKDTKQISDNRIWSFGVLVGGVIVGFISIYSGKFEVFIPISIFSAYIAFYNCASLGSLNETRKQIQLLKEAIKKMQEGIVKTRAHLEDIKMRADINM